MTSTEYEAPDGRLYRVLVPEHDVEHPERGVRIGPPDLTALNLPFDLMVRLHNGLYHRGLYRSADINARRMDALSAWQAALAVDIDRIHGLYVKQEPKTAQPEGSVVVTSEGPRDVPKSIRHAERVVQQRRT